MLPGTSWRRAALTPAPSTASARSPLRGTPTTVPPVPRRLACARRAPRRTVSPASAPRVRRRVASPWQALVPLCQPQRLWILAMRRRPIPRVCRIPRRCPGTARPPARQGVAPPRPATGRRVTPGAIQDLAAGALTVLQSSLVPRRATPSVHVSRPGGVPTRTPRQWLRPPATAPLRTVAQGGAMPPRAPPPGTRPVRPPPPSHRLTRLKMRTSVARQPCCEGSRAGPSPQTPSGGSPTRSYVITT